jgi:maltose/moltooligosaccharide transporter
MQNPSNRRQKFFYSFGQFGNGVYNGFNNYILTLFVSSFTGNAFIQGYLGNTRTMEGVIIQPLVGRWSDRTTSRMGRRRPFILFGVPISVFFLLLTPIFGHTNRSLALPLLAASIILFSITWNMAGDPYQALMVDITQPEERSKFNAILSVIALVGTIVILVYTQIVSLNKNNIPDVAFYACALFLLVSYAVVFFGVREPQHVADLAHIEKKIPLRQYLDDLRAYKEPRKLLLSIFFLWSGLNPILPFLTLFVKKDLHATTSQALIATTILTLSAGIFAYPFGLLGVRYGTRRMIVLGTLLLLSAAVLGIVVPTYTLLFPVAILAGAGFSATTVLTYPYLADLVPVSKIGVFTGLQTAFSAVAAPVSIAITALLIELFHHSYRPMFAMLAITMVFDVIFLLSIDEKAAHEQLQVIEARDLMLATDGAPVA